MNRYPSTLHWLLLLIGSTIGVGSARADAELRWLFVPITGGAPDPAFPPAAVVEPLERALASERRVFENRRAAAVFENEHSSDPEQLSDEQLAKHLEVVGRGRRLLAFGQRAEAQEKLQSIEELTGPVRDFLQRSPKRAQLFFDACVVTAQLLLREKQAEQARQQMTKCVRTWPGYEPGRNDTRTRKLFDEAREQLDKEPHGVLVVTGGATGCAVRVNGLELSRTPAKLRIPVGHVRVQLECQRDVPGRIHAVAVGAGETHLAIDQRFDAAVHTEEELWLAYPDATSRTAHMDEDAAAIGRIVGTRQVALLLLDSAQRRVTVRVAGKDIAILPFAADSGYPGAAVEELTQKLRTRASPPSPPRVLVPARRLESAVGEGERHERDDSGSEVRVALGIAAVATGVLGLGLSWGLYTDRYSMRSRMYFGDVGYGDLDRFRDDAAWLMASGILGSAALVGAEALLLPEADGVPTSAWLLGGAGVAVGLAGMALGVFGSHCQPRAAAPCDDFAADSLLGPLIALHAVPLVAVPAIYAVRLWSGSSKVELRAEGSLVSLRGSF